MPIKSDDEAKKFICKLVFLNQFYYRFIKPEEERLSVTLLLTRHEEVRPGIRRRNMELGLESFILVSANQRNL